MSKKIKECLGKYKRSGVIKITPFFIDFKLQETLKYYTIKEMERI